MFFHRRIEVLVKFIRHTHYLSFLFILFAGINERQVRHLGRQIRRQVGQSRDIG